VPFLTAARLERRAGALTGTEISYEGGVKVAFGRAGRIYREIPDNCRVDLQFQREVRISDLKLRVISPLRNPEMPEDSQCKKSTRPEEARKAVRKFWIAATAGAFLAGLSRNLPVDLANIAWPANWPPNWPYTLDLLLRYGYLFWFLFYFAISSFSTEQRPAKDTAFRDIAFDLMQSIPALLAVYYIGFVDRARPPSPRTEYIYANFVILWLSLLSWFFFSLPRRKANSTGWRFCLERISVLRELGIILSLLGILSVHFCFNTSRLQSQYTYAWFIFLQLVLWVVLGFFWRIRWNHPKDKSLPGDIDDTFETERISCRFWRKKV
jgi:hypothetical protein